MKRGQRELTGVRSAYLERLSKKKQARIQPSPSVGVPAVPGTEPGQFRLCPLCEVPFTPDHFISDPGHAMRWWTRYAIRHLRQARICDEPHAGKPCRAWHIGQAVQGRGYARELRRRHEA